MADPIIEPVVESKIEPAPAPEPKVELAPEPKLDLKVEPVVEPKAEPAPIPKPKPKSEDWRDRHIAELTARLNAERIKTAAAPKPADPDSDFETRVATEAEARAAEIARVTEWNRQCNDVAAAGRAVHTDFDERIAAVRAVVNGQDPTEAAQYNDVLSAAIETGKAHQLIYSLGENPGEVRRLMALSPTKRAMELATMAAKIDAAPPAPEPSAAPKPITPVGSRGLHYDGIAPDDAARGMKLPKAEWFKQREKQVQERGLQ